MRILCASAVIAFCAGCSITDWCNLDGATGPVAEYGPPKPAPEFNPLFLPLTREDYPRVFETLLTVLDDFGFEIIESNRADGRIETAPRTSPGLFLILKPGTADLWERTLYTFQSYRDRVTIRIHGDRGGYFIEVVANKELEDLARPIRNTIGAAVFRPDNNIDRPFEIIDIATPSSGWLFKGRDRSLEQELLFRIRHAI